MEKVTAMPYLCDSTDFGLGKDAANHKFARQLMEKRHKLVLVYELGDGVNVYRSGSMQNGSLFMYNPATEIIGYYVRYETVKKKLTGHTVTQTAVWRALQEPKASGLTKRVVFEYLLAHYPAIMSDKMQTERGRDFWIDLMFQALARGYRVALADFNMQHLHEIDNAAELRLWYSGDDEHQPAWGDLNRHMALRFIIFAK